jgi:hypothetical protein
LLLAKVSKKKKKKKKKKSVEVAGACGWPLHILALQELFTFCWSKETGASRGKACCLWAISSAHRINPSIHPSIHPACIFLES